MQEFGRKETIQNNNEKIFNYIFTTENNKNNNK